MGLGHGRERRWSALMIGYLSHWLDVYSSTVDLKEFFFYDTLICISVSNNRLLQSLPRSFFFTSSLFSKFRVVPALEPAAYGFMHELTTDEWDRLAAV